MLNHSTLQQIDGRRCPVFSAQAINAVFSRCSADEWQTLRIPLSETLESTTILSMGNGEESK
jgi:hypothetical protein